MSSSFFGWMAISAVLFCLYLPAEGRRSASRDAARSEGHRVASDTSPDADGSSCDDSGSDDSDKGDSGD
jgi:hypothetical protein